MFLSLDKDGFDFKRSEMEIDTTVRYSNFLLYFLQHIGKPYFLCVVKCEGAVCVIAFSFVKAKDICIFNILGRLDCFADNSGMGQREEAGNIQNSAGNKRGG